VKKGRRQFLKKGEGISRFSAAPKKPKKPSKSVKPVKSASPPLATTSHKVPSVKKKPVKVNIFILIKF
jgi:hypothetical protein